MRTLSQSTRESLTESASRRSRCAPCRRLPSESFSRKNKIALSRMKNRKKVEASLPLLLLEYLPVGFAGGLVSFAFNPALHVVQPRELLGLSHEVGLSFPRLGRRAGTLSRALAPGGYCFAFAGGLYAFGLPFRRAVRLHPDGGRGDAVRLVLAFCRVLRVDLKFDSSWRNLSDSGRYHLACVFEQQVALRLLAYLHR